VKRSSQPDPEPLAGTVDAHAHTWSREFDGDYDATMDRAWAAGLAAVVEVGVDASTSRRALDLAGYDSRIHAVVGLHPHEAKRLDEERAALESLASSGDFVAVGEIGLDFYRDLSPRDKQYAAFDWQLDLARERELPVVIHSRDADLESFEVIEAWAARVGRYLGPEREIGMMHCFAGDAELARRYIELGLLISIPGTVTYGGNERGQAVARSLPGSAMLIETDCPYLTPAPHRGSRNEPAYVVETARFVASIRGERPEAVASASAQNAGRLFGFSVDAEAQ
jgi:TatD DNase family protein